MTEAWLLVLPPPLPEFFWLPTHAALSQALAENGIAVHALQARMGMVGVRFAGFRFGNLNTPADLAAAGIQAPAAR